MASGPGTGVAAPPAEHIAKGTIHDPALQAAVTRAMATNDTASLAAMLPTIQNAVSQPGAAGSALAALAPALQTAITTAGQVVQLPAPQQQALTQMAAQFAQQPVQQYQQQVARAQVRRVTADVNPQLEQIRQDLETRGNQIQATSEHRRIEQRKAFQRQVLSRLGVIERLSRISRY